MILKYLSVQPLRIIYLLLILSLFGCGKFLKEPEVHINSVQIKNIKNFEAVFIVNIEVYNPNYIPFNIKHVECDFEMANQHIASAISDENISIPAHGTGNVPLEIHSNSFDLITTVIKSFMFVSKTGNKQIDYNIHGKILLGGFLYGSDTISFSSAGNLLEKHGQSKENNAG
jgi:LEA14-like dessication related protein